MTSLLTCTCPQPTWVQQTSGLETYYYSEVLWKEEKRTMHCRNKGMIIRMPYLSFIYASGPRMVKATTSRSTQSTSWLIPPALPALQQHDMLHNLAAREVKQHVSSMHLPPLSCSYRNFQSPCFRNLHGFHLGTWEKYEEPALTMIHITIDLTEKSAVGKIPIPLIFPKLY